MNLQDELSRSGLTNNELAKRLGVSISYVGMLKLGTRKPSVPLAKKIATVLGCKWTDFFEDDIKDTE